MDVELAETVQRSTNGVLRYRLGELTVDHRGARVHVEISEFDLRARMQRLLLESATAPGPADETPLAQAAALLRDRLVRRIDDLLDDAGVVADGMSQQPAVDPIEDDPPREPTVVSTAPVAARSASIRVERNAATISTPSKATTTFAAFHEAVGADWTPGRVTVTTRRLTFVPQRLGAVSTRLDLDLADVTGIDLTGGRANAIVIVRTRSHVAYLRILNGEPFAHQLATLAKERRGAL